MEKAEDDWERTKLELEQSTSGQILPEKLAKFVQENVLRRNSRPEDGEDGRGKMNWERRIGRGKRR